MKIDPHKHKERYFAWKEKIRGRIPDISKTNSELILRYLDDMEKGLNIAKGSVKGSRSYPRLNNLRQRMIFLSKKFKELLKVEELTNLNEEQLVPINPLPQKSLIPPLKFLLNAIYSSFSRLLVRCIHSSNKVQLSFLRTIK